eukprot:1151768-Pelagomonas_calceolata.AAC.8
MSSASQQGQGQAVLLLKKQLRGKGADACQHTAACSRVFPLVFVISKDTLCFVAPLLMGAASGHLCYCSGLHRAVQEPGGGVLGGPGGRLQPV